MANGSIVVLLVFFIGLLLGFLSGAFAEWGRHKLIDQPPSGPTRRGEMSKYHAKPTTVDNIRFHSANEARRYQELRLLEKAGKIKDLELQPKFPLMAPERGNAGPWGRGHVGDYIADFRYREGPRGILVVEDVKSKPTKTALWRWKVKHLRIQYGIEVLTT